MSPRLPRIMSRRRCARIRRRIGAWLGSGAAFVVAAAVADAGDDYVTIDNVVWQVRPLGQETFKDSDWRARWALEGNATVTVRDGGMLVVTSEAKSEEPAATLWWREPLPADVMVQLTARPVAPVEGNAANVNLFFHAREADGSPYRFGRSGRYGEYHTIPNYIMTLTGGFQEGWARLRRNPGFRLLHEDASVRSEVGGTYRIRVVIAGGRIRYWINDRLIHDQRDEAPLPGGRFALRTWRSRIRWAEIRFFALEPVSGRASPARDPNGGKNVMTNQ